MSTTNARDERDLGAFIPSNLDDYGLDPFEFRVYSHIARRAGSGECWESINNIAACCNMNVKTARKAIAVLTAARLIWQSTRKGTTNSITLSSSKHWVDSNLLGQIRAKLTPTKSGSTKSGTPPLPDQDFTPTRSGTPPLPDQVPKGIPSKVLPEVSPFKGENENEREINASLQEPEVSPKLPALPVNQEDSSAPSNTSLRANYSAARKTFTEENIEAPEWAMHEAPWHASLIKYQESMLQAVADVSPKWEGIKLLDGSRNDHAIAKYLRKLENSGANNFGPNSIKARADLLGYWDQAQKTESRRRQAEELRTTTAPVPTESRPGYYSPYAPIDLEQARRGKEIALAAMARAKEELQRAGA
ncbi:helix-turn-helix domain-containing protein [Phormidium sp. FACHB-592]|uniref:Helix-turn-helix domain-containing protein n=1 Tax=Stenomitos frigidus AS-A4 TaxID=2933935 RepID=A0ABV0KH70_9CYAN|nr:helix-turn-helix domain-containing protein [Phormidium sp. FACHB-592]MBD2076347.1 helix-turn-helix domain-containing protein [Phormidium sp. FACHB-592]